MTTTVTKCAVCGRTLKAAASVAAGVGPECGKKKRGKVERKRQEMNVSSSEQEKP